MTQCPWAGSSAAFLPSGIFPHRLTGGSHPAPFTRLLLSKILSRCFRCPLQEQEPTSHSASQSPKREPRLVFQSQTFSRAFPPSIRPLGLEELSMGFRPLILEETLRIVTILPCVGHYLGRVLTMTTCPPISLSWFLLLISCCRPVVQSLSRVHFATPFDCSTHEASSAPSLSPTAVLNSCPL